MEKIKFDTYYKYRAYKPSAPDAEDATDDRAKVEWVVRATAGGSVKLTARHERAGVAIAQVELGEADSE